MRESVEAIGWDVLLLRDMGPKKRIKDEVHRLDEFRIGGGGILGVWSDGPWMKIINAISKVNDEKGYQ